MKQRSLESRESAAGGRAGGGAAGKAGRAARERAQQFHAEFARVAGSYANLSGGFVLWGWLAMVPKH